MWRCEIGDVLKFNLPALAERTSGRILFLQLPVFSNKRHYELLIGDISFLIWCSITQNPRRVREQARATRARGHKGLICCARCGGFSAALLLFVWMMHGVNFYAPPNLDRTHCDKWNHGEIWKFLIPDRVKSNSNQRRNKKKYSEKSHGERNFWIMKAFFGLGE